MLPGVDKVKNPLGRTAFRSSWSQPEGPGDVLMHEARIVDVNVVNWTVDCVTVFDQKNFFDIQVASPYAHSTRGEGVYVMPDIGAKCYVCVPSDGPPPFVAYFIMPAESVSDAGSEQAPAGTQGGQSDGATPTSSTYQGGRPRAKPGDIVMRGRDGNFCILHRGGVLQVGSTELAQRIFVPLENLVTDISQTYNHFNSGGAINWGIRQSSSDLETEYKHTFRVYADDEFADIRLAVGKVHQPVPEKPGDASSSADLSELEIGTVDPIVFEMVLAPGNGFETDAGTPSPETRDAVKLRVFFDRGGNGMARLEGSLSLRVKKRLRIRVDEDVEIFSKSNIVLRGDGAVSITGGPTLQIGTDGGVLKLNGGTKPVATVGSQVLITTVVPIPIMTPAGPGTILAGAVFSGSISTGNSTILG